MSRRIVAVIVGVAAAIAGLFVTAPSTAAPAAERVARVPSTVETVPTREPGDTADDPAIWVDRARPARSLIFGNDKRGALEVYRLDGSRKERIVTGQSFWGNVDVRQRVRLGGSRYDIVAAMNGGLRFYSIDPDTRVIESRIASRQALPTGGGEGLCLYHPDRTARLYAFVVARDGRVRQYRVDDQEGNGFFEIRRVRQFSLGSEGEGCVADDTLRRVYLSQEDVALWRYDADPGAGAARARVDRVGGAGHLVSDVEGVTLAARGSGGRLIVSAQNVRQPERSYFTVYSRQSNRFVKAFRIVAGPRSDGCERTDGVAAYAGPLGPRFPRGVFVCQDDSNVRPGAGHQDFKLTRLERIL